jgi:hypothetical protein
MEFDHERLHVYQLAFEFLGPFTSGRSTVSCFVVDRAQCRGGRRQVSAADKRRYCVSARGSATESAALLAVCFQLKLIAEEQHRTGKEILWRIVAMLVKLARSLEKH